MWVDLCALEHLSEVLRECCLCTYLVEQYYNGNVLTRRTAQQDFQLAQKLAKKLQGQENQAYHELKKREREDSELATELNSAELAEKERMRENMRKLAVSYFNYPVKPLIYSIPMPLVHSSWRMRGLQQPVKMR